jgi:hypothetical protein
MTELQKFQIASAILIADLGLVLYKYHKLQKAHKRQGDKAQNIISYLCEVMIREGVSPEEFDLIALKELGLNMTVVPNEGE